MDFVRQKYSNLKSKTNQNPIFISTHLMAERRRGGWAELVIKIHIDNLQVVNFIGMEERKTRWKSVASMKVICVSTGLKNPSSTCTNPPLLSPDCNPCYPTHGIKKWQGNETKWNKNDKLKVQSKTIPLDASPAWPEFTEAPRKFQLEKIFTSFKLFRNNEKKKENHKIFRSYFHRRRI